MDGKVFEEFMQKSGVNEFEAFKIMQFFGVLYRVTNHFASNLFGGLKNGIWFSSFGRIVPVNCFRVAVVS